MKQKSPVEPLDDDLRPEYGPEFFKNMNPNRFANVEIAPQRTASKRRQKRKAS